MPGLVHDVDDVGCTYLARFRCVRLTELCIFVIYMGCFDNQDGKEGGKGPACAVGRCWDLFCSRVTETIYHCGAAPGIQPTSAGGLRNMKIYVS